MNQMNKMKQIIFGFMAVAFMAACSSGEELGQEPQLDNKEWKSISFSTGVEQGTTVNTRTIGDLDPNSLPKAAYPEGLGIYMHQYDVDKEKTSESIVINEEGSSNNRIAHFVYRIDASNNLVHLKKDEDSSEEIAVRIAAKQTGNIYPENCDLFFFASRKEVDKIQFPKVENNLYENEYPDAREEFGDKLFSSEGYFFQWKEFGKELGLYYILSNDYEASHVSKFEIVEVPNWEKMQLDLSMKRLTVCVSIRLMLIKEYGEDKVESIYNENKDLESAVDATNVALRKYVKSKGYSDEVIKSFETFDVRNICVRKKILQRFPIVYDWKSGLSTKERGNLYLCNLDYPSWIDKSISYENGKYHIYGLTATCDNEPFIPFRLEHGDLPNIPLTLFLGIGDYETSEVSKLVSYIININTLSLRTNTHTYLYVGFTLQDIVDLYLMLSGQEDLVKTRSASSMPEVILPSNRLFITSEPYTGQHAH